MIIVNEAVLIACQTFVDTDGMKLSVATPAEILMQVCRAAIKAKGDPQPRPWWTAHLEFPHLGMHLAKAKILIMQGEDFLYCPEGHDAKMVGSGASVDWFNEFWKAYEPGPGLTAKAKGARAAALKAWAKISPMDKPLFDRIVAAAKKEVESAWSGSNGHNPHAATWLNQKRWEDVEADKNAATPAGMSKEQRTSSLADRMRRMSSP